LAAPDTRLVGDIYSELEAKYDLEAGEETKKKLMTKKPVSRLVGTNAVQAKQRMRGRYVS
jgi:hypothetical protein